MRNLVYTLLIQTRRTAPYSGSCAPEVATAGQKLTCTVVYEGLEVPFEVTVTSGSPLYQYTAAQKKFVLTREAVRYPM